MITYTVTTAGLEPILTKLTPGLYMKPLQGLLNEASLIAQRTARQEAPRDTAALQRSIMREVTPLMARVFTPLDYAPTMEVGRRPGAAMPPPDALAGWARRHGIPATALFVLARAIARRGIKGRFFMRAGKEAVERDMPRLLAQMRAKIEANWAGREAAGGA